jgi:serine phosphatase RsbU (regulator of sigma subunit)
MKIPQLIAATPDSALVAPTARLDRPSARNASSLRARMRHSTRLQSDARTRRELEAAHRRMSVLARTGELLERSLDLHQTLPPVGALIAREVAQSCRIEVVGTDRRLAAIVDTGVTDDAGVVSYPLLHDGRRLGVLSVVAHGLVSADHELLTDIGRRISSAVANAQLYADRDHVATTLERSLLPAALPHIDGFELAAAYRPAAAGSEVGGDFYDAFAMGDGEWAMVLGDVCGKGAGAAAVTAMARYGVRTITGHEQRPGHVLRELNDGMLRHGDRERFCTAIFATVHEQDRRIELASGGHPPPTVLAADGTTRSVDVAGTLLGVTTDPSLPECELTLEPGDALVLFTDGILEARSRTGHMLGADGVHAALRTVAGASAQTIADLLVRIAQTAPGGQRDDAAALVLRAR